MKSNHKFDNLNRNKFQQVLEINGWDLLFKYKILAMLDPSFEVNKFEEKEKNQQKMGNHNDCLQQWM
jgi:hypothetical protein